MDQRFPRGWRDNIEQQAGRHHGGRQRAASGRSPAGERAASIAGQRPDRFALWALLLGLFMILLTAATAGANSGGMTSPSDSEFGTRVLRVGMEGDDVKVLKGIVGSKSFARGVRIDEFFDGPTADAVRSFQRRKGMKATGVVNRSTAEELTSSMRIAGATWYGPGFYGNETACGTVLRPGTVGVAHKSLPCGTKVTFSYGGRYLVTRVIDRGPYTAGYTWDLTNGAREILGFDYSDDVRYAVGR